MEFRVRFAPSPTGLLHIGNARTAFFNWLYARKEGGKLVLRIEDTDLARSTQESVDNILSAFKWLGLNYDEGHGVGGPYAPYRQSERLDQYRDLGAQLVRSGKAYFCYDSEEELETSRGEWQNEHSKQRHPHRDIGSEQKAAYEAEGRKPSIRFATDDLKGDVVYQDLVRGEVRISMDEIRDFNLMKSDGMPMYNFSAVADDHAMQISHVIRGEDGISNTPRQILIYQALGWEIPQFGHVSFIFGPDGQKLSKRHGSASIDEFRAAGYLPQAVLNYLGLLGLGGHGEGEEIFSLEQLIARFSVEHLVKKASIFDYGKLDFLNAHYLRATSGADLRGMIGEFKAPSDAWLDEALDLVKANAIHLIDLIPLLREILDDEFSHGPEALAEARAFGSAKAAAESLKTSFAAEGFPTTAEDAKARYKSAQKNSGIKGKDFFMPTRLALTGVAHGPEIVRLIPLMGEARCMARLDAFLKVV